MRWRPEKQEKPSNSPLPSQRKTDRFARSGRAVFPAGGFTRWLPTLLALTVLSCGGDEHPELLGDTNNAVNPNGDDAPACAELDGGSCDNDTPSAPQPAAPEFQCLTEEQTADFDDPLTSVVQAFDTDLFFPTETKPVGGAARLMTLGRLPRSWACTEAEAGATFELLGGLAEDEDGGGLRIDPVGHDEFYPTMIQRVDRAGRSYTVIPVVGTNELDGIFADLDVARDPNKGQILIEAVYVPSPGERHRLNGIEFESGAAETVAYRSAEGWSTDLEETSVDGLALLINVNSADHLGLSVDWHYTDHTKSDPTAIKGEAKLYSISGGVTYLAMTPEGFN